MYSHSGSRSSKGDRNVAACRSFSRSSAAIRAIIASKPSGSNFTMTGTVRRSYDTHY